jgi:hypothetical protein
LSRIRTLVLLATVAALAVAFAACGGGGGSDSGSSEDPQKVIDQATLEGVKSGNLDLSLKVKASGEKSGNFDVSLSGPFQAGAKNELPEADLKVKANGEAEGENIDFEGGVTLLSDRAYIGYKGDEYEVDPTTFGFIKSGFEQSEQETQGEGAEAEACQEAAVGLKPADFIDNLKSEGGQEVEGTSTTEVSGDLNVKGAIDQIIKLTEDPSCASQLQMAGPLPLGELEQAEGELESAVKSAHASVYVGDEDNIIRKVSAEMEIEPKGSGEKIEISFEISLGQVNEKQTISAPANAKPLEGLFQQLGVNPLELLEGGSSGGLGGLLEGISGGSMESSGSGESSEAEIEPSELPGSEESTKYLECLQGAETPSDLQKCASLLK